MFVSWVLGINGEYVRKELPGPPDFEAWWRSWRVLKTVYLLLKICSAERLDSYGEHIRKLHIRFGPEFWWIVYQADIKMRLEHFERLRRIAEAVHQASVGVAGATSSFNPKKPWDTVFSMAVGARDFWSEHVTDPALLFLSQVKTRANLEDDLGSAPIQSNSPPSKGGNKGNGQKRQFWEVDTSPTSASSGGDGSRQGADGRFTHNRKGGPLCHGFQDGSCGPGVYCPKGYKHQCAICLDNRHGAHECRNSKPSFSGKGKKGKGKGKKGRGKW